MLGKSIIFMYVIWLSFNLIDITELLRYHSFISVSIGFFKLLCWINFIDFNISFLNNMRNLRFIFFLEWIYFKFRIIIFIIFLFLILPNFLFILIKYLMGRFFSLYLVLSWHLLL